MATIRYFDDLANKGITQIYDTETFNSNKATATLMTFDDKYGARVEIRGSGFEYQYPHGPADAGQVQSVVMRDKDGDVVETITGLQMTASDVFDNLVGYGTSALTFLFNSGFDKITGSRADDVMGGGAGNDKIAGGTGEDRLYGGSGTDFLTGGRGSDSFWFVGGCDRDFITDFDDKGAEQDVIQLTRDQYDNLKIFQVGDNVVLNLLGDQMIIEHAHKSDIHKDDFLIIG